MNLSFHSIGLIRSNLISKVKCLYVFPTCLYLSLGLFYKNTTPKENGCFVVQSLLSYLLVGGVVLLFRTLVNIFNSIVSSSGFTLHTSDVLTNPGYVIGFCSISD